MTFPLLSLQKFRGNLPKQSVKVTDFALGHTRAYLLSLIIEHLFSLGARRLSDTQIFV